MYIGKSFGVFICLLVAAAGQFPRLPGLPRLPRLPDLSNLPSPEEFLESLLNVTPKELLEVVGDFTFDEVLSDHIQFLLYNNNGSVTVLDTYSDRHHIESQTEPIKFIIHGWQAAGDIDFVQNMAKSYHSIGIYNVFGVDWSPHSKRNYLHSARGTKKIGEIVGDFVMNLIKNNTRLLSNVHLIGHSLGAQVSGFAGKHIQALTKGKKIGRITGLDAAAPLFEFPIKLPHDLRLTNEDADYVDGIHTNAGFFGFLAPYGHGDHYVDLGGPIQPGCAQINVFEAFVCSHLKSHDIYNNTITSKIYLSSPCGNIFRAAINMCDNSGKVVMGEHTSTKAKGEYFIDIDSNNLPMKRRGIRNILPQIAGFNV
ncbi:phospholipase A1 3-like [Anoplophora glabripennis]|uniref:phospholipase A1 3-like n=1 Tax=Anoplophora glabripennis TaxID=217634 RepID=UPI00087421E3|nr:phospholipase A1 3-like [Anoplophora glabripennis]